MLGRSGICCNRLIVQQKNKVVNPTLSILDRDDSLLYTANMDTGNKSNNTGGI